MKKIFWGMIFVFFNFTLTFNQFKLGLIPDFIGYLLMLSGTLEIFSESDRFTKVKPVLIIMAVLSTLFYINDCFGLVNITDQTIILLMNGILVIGNLYCTYMITCGVKDVEINHQVDLAADQLMYRWKVKAMFTILTYLILFIPMLSFISLLVSVIFAILYLVAFKRTQRLYEACLTINP